MKWIFWLFLALYAFAAVIFLIGTFGWFGQDKDPLSAVFLMPLGLPWNLFADRLGALGPLVALLAPAVNAGILLWLWR
ncbi:hypothetical protein K3175_03295 [Qipengyuania sp. GH1]|uniref:hypothetical protein n=1 Tax=Qipengyuania aestuarii TaxID=2867241 RepID=UPI001C88DC20|nr:hypothetical protein [Qipengyuania aestuarii]MBX7534676.1 hypothetical protein [Qipengyuania aestuarii]